MQTNNTHLKTIEDHLNPPQNATGHPSTPTRVDLISALSFFLEALKSTSNNKDNAHKEIEAKTQDLYNKACDGQPTGTPQFLNELDAVYRLLEKHHLFKTTRVNDNKNTKPVNRERI